MNLRRVFSHWEINNEKFASSAMPVTGLLCSRSHAAAEHADCDFSSRRVRKKPPQADIDEFKAKCSELRRFATAPEQVTLSLSPQKIVGLPPSNLTSYTRLACP